MSSRSELIQKYNIPGPRYTSYPTVPYWDQTPTEEQWLTTIERSLQESRTLGRGAAVYIHIPFCQSLCTYCGCNTRITRNRSVASPYIDTLDKEWSLYHSHLGTISVSELHLGGGTPTFMTPDELSKMMDLLGKKMVFAPEAELSLEADPRVTTRDHLKALREYGFRRLSLGIQDFDPKVQQSVNRVQTIEQVRLVVEAAREFGYTSINFDLIYGLPFQTLESVRGTIEAVSTLRPDRIAFYSYAHVPWIKPGQRRFTEADLPNGESKRALYELGRQLFEEAGYREVGMDHFALTTDSMWKATETGELHRNFMGYTSRHVSPLFGLGVSAIGDSWYAFSQNEKLLENYQARVAEGRLPIHRGHVLNAEDLAIRWHILNLMTRMQTSWIEPSFQTPYLDSIEGRLGEFVTDQLIELGEKSLKVKEAGRPFLRNICMAFDARLARKAPETKLFSKTI